MTLFFGFKPRATFLGVLVVEAMLVDDFIKRVSFHTIGDKQKIAALERRLTLWKHIAVGASALVAMFLWGMIAG